MKIASFSNKMVSTKKLISTSSLLFLLTFSLTVSSLSGCKSSKKAKAKAEQEARMAKEKEDQRKREEEERLRKEALDKAKRSSSSNEQIEDLFAAISKSSNTEAANANIGEALNYFSSPDAPVLIIISKNGDDNDYDEPTTIAKYLNYLKDQKKTYNKVDKAVYDSNGKIKELILTTK